MMPPRKTWLASRQTFKDLMPRELQVLRRLYKGFANQKIADALHIGKETVKSHLKKILRKLRVANRTEAVTTAIQCGIIHLPNKRHRT